MARCRSRRAAKDLRSRHRSRLAPRGEHTRTRLSMAPCRQVHDLPSFASRSEATTLLGSEVFSAVSRGPCLCCCQPRLKLAQNPVRERSRRAVAMFLDELIGRAEMTADRFAQL